MALLAQPIAVKNSQASTYNATKGTVKAPTDTVSGQMNTLLAQNSDYMKNARTSGLQTAQSRGLLNSSMAGQASQLAAIQSALPIAQSDANIYSTQRMANQAASNEAGRFNAGSQTQVSLANAGSQNVANLSQFKADSEIDMANVNNTANLARDSQSQAATSNLAAQNNASLESRDAASQASQTERSRIQAATSLTNSATDASRAAATTYQSDRLEIQTNPDISNPDKAILMSELDANHQNALNLISSVNGIALDWDFGTTPAATPTITTAPTV